MAIFINLIIIFIYILTFIVSYFIVDQIINSKHITNYNLPKSILDFAEGTLYGVISVLFQFWLYNTNQQFSPYLFIVSGIVVVFLRSATIGVYSIIGIMLLTLFLYDNISTNKGFIFYYMLGITFITMTISAIGNNYINIQKSLGLTIVSIILNIIIFWFMTVIMLQQELSTIFLISTILPFIMSIVIMSTVSYLVLFFKSANILYENSKFDFGEFHRETFHEKAIHEYIMQKGISVGIYTLINIDWSVEDPRLTKELTKKVLIKLQNSFVSSHVLFKADNNNYGFFMKIKSPINIKLMINNNKCRDRIGNDSLTKIESLIESLNGFYSDRNNSGAVATVRSGSIIYGIQESSIKKLRDRALFAIKTSKWNKYWNTASLFNPKLFKQKVKDSIDILTLRSNADISYISHEYYPVIDIEKKKTIMNVSNTIVADGGVISLTASYKYAKEIGKMKLLKRYISAKSIMGTENWFDSKVSIDYSAQLMTEKEFSDEDFISSIHRFKQLPTNIIINFNINDLNEVNESSVFKRNLKYIQRSGVQIALLNVRTQSEIENILWMNPMYIYFSIYEIDETEIDKIIKYCKNNEIEIIANKISSTEELKEVLTKKISKVGGILFNQNELYPTNFNKKDKIYIEQIENGGKL